MIDDSMRELLSATWLSFAIAVSASLLAGGVGIPIAYLVCRNRFFLRPLLDLLITLPLVLPPTVLGYVLLVLLGRRGWPGSWMDRLLDYSMLFRFEAAVVAAAVVCLPLVYLPARASFASVPREMQDLARLLGASPLEAFWYVSLPLAARGIAGGLVLAFARALGEFGATLMVFGWRDDRITLPVLVWTSYQNPSASLIDALPAALVLSAISLLTLLIYNRALLSRND
jgi:molybdate transport system permease protein